MEVEKKTEKIGFKDFLDKCTNLITLCGIFNALFIYALTIKDSDLDQFLIPSFLILSIFTWYELILFTLKSSDESTKYQIFSFLLLSIQIGLVLLFFKKFPEVFIYSCLVVVFFGLTFWVLKIFNWLFFDCLPKKWIEKIGGKRTRNILILVSILVTAIILEILSKYISPYTRAFAQEFIARLGSPEYSIFPAK